MSEEKKRSRRVVSKVEYAAHQGKKAAYALSIAATYLLIVLLGVTALVGTGAFFFFSEDTGNAMRAAVVTLISGTCFFCLNQTSRADGR